MSNLEQLARLKEGVAAWNKWRESNPPIKPDLSEADLRGANLVVASLSEADLRKADLRGARLNGSKFFQADFREADLSEADLRGAELVDADLSEANLSKARLDEADLRGANLSRAHLSETNFHKADLTMADLRGADLSKAFLAEAKLAQAKLNGANLSEANLLGAHLCRADLSGACLIEADLREADLTEANFSGVKLSKADLKWASLVEANFKDADLTGCRVYGASVWDVKLDGAKQSSLIITPHDEPAIQVDNLEVAQFIYLLLKNAKVREVIDTITSKVVLILGRFTPERKAVLDVIREELRKRDYVPVLFDFEKPASKDFTGTISTLANMARFIIADLTDPSSVPHELATLVPATVVPVQSILLEGQREYAMFPDLVRRYHWVLEPYQYKSVDSLFAQLNEHVLAPAEAKAIELRKKVAGSS